MHARQADGLPIQTQTRAVMRGLRPNLTSQIGTYGHLAEGRVEVLEEINQTPPSVLYQPSRPWRFTLPRQHKLRS